VLFDMRNLVEGSARPRRGSHTPHIRSPRGAWRGCRDRSEFKNRTEQNISPPTQAKVCAAGRGHRNRNRSLPDYRRARRGAQVSRSPGRSRQVVHACPVPRAALCPGPQMRAIGRGRAAEGGTARRRPSHRREGRNIRPSLHAPHHGRPARAKVPPSSRRAMPCYVVRPGRTFRDSEHAAMALRAVRSPPGASAPPAPHAVLAQASELRRALRA
jgi:hypothetical protein